MDKKIYENLFLLTVDIDNFVETIGDFPAEAQLLDTCNAKLKRIFNLFNKNLSNRPKLKTVLITLLKEIQNFLKNDFAEENNLQLLEKTKIFMRLNELLELVIKN